MEKKGKKDFLRGSGQGGGRCHPQLLWRPRVRWKTQFSDVIAGSKIFGGGLIYLCGSKGELNSRWQLGSTRGVLYCLKICPCLIHSISTCDEKWWEERPKEWGRTLKHPWLVACLSVTPPPPPNSHPSTSAANAPMRGNEPGDTGQGKENLILTQFFCRKKKRTLNSGAKITTA